MIEGPDQLEAAVRAIDAHLRQRRVCFSPPLRCSPAFAAIVAREVRAAISPEAWAALQREPFHGLHLCSCPLIIDTDREWKGPVEAQFQIEQELPL